MEDADDGNLTMLIADNASFLCSPFSNATSPYDVYSCYGFFVSRALLLTILELSLGVSSVVANGFVFWLILKNSKLSITSSI